MCDKADDKCPFWFVVSDIVPIQHKTQEMFAKVVSDEFA